MGLSYRFRIAVALMIAVLAVGTLGYQILLGASFLDALYMTVITLSTVGFGETAPGLTDSTAGRVFTMVLIMLGMGILLYFVSATTAFFVEGELTNLLRRRKMDQQIARLENHIILCGVGNTGMHAAEELSAVQADFVVVESEQSHLDRALARTKFLYLVGDATEEATLTRAGIERARGVLVVLSNDKDNLFVTFTARSLNARARIVSRGVDPNIRQRMRRAGADSVVVPNHIGGLRMTSEMVRPHVVSFLDRMLRPGAQATWRFEEISIEASAACVGRTLGSLDIPGRVGLPVLALSAGDGKTVTYYPPTETVLQADQCLVVLAEHDQIERLRQVIANG